MEWTGARYADKPTVQVQTWIDAPPQRVWALVSDVELMPTMSKELQSIEWLDGATGPAVGARFTGHSKHEALGEWADHLGGDRVRARAGARLGRGGLRRTPTAIWRFRLEPPKDGGTELSQWMQMGPGALRPVVCHRSNAGQRAEDRIRADARVRAEHDPYRGAHQKAGGNLMRTATTIEAASFDRLVATQRDFVVEAEKLGLDICWVAEAWGSDAPSALGYYAACTDRMLLGSGIIQVGTRTPVAVAQAAITLSNLSGGRFLLGLGASGPQVIEGLHGVSFARPARAHCAKPSRSCAGHSTARQDLLLRQRVSDSLARRGRGCSWALGCAPSTPIPIYLATLLPAMLRLTGEIADGWLGSGFSARRRRSGLWIPRRRFGARRDVAAPTSTSCQGAEVAFAPDEEALREMVANRKKELAFSLGGIGWASTNFYNQAYAAKAGPISPTRSAGAGRPVTVAPRGSGWLGGGMALAATRLRSAPKPWCGNGCGSGATPASRPCGSPPQETHLTRGSPRWPGPSRSSVR